MEKTKITQIVCGSSFLKIYNIDNERRDKIWNYFKFVDDKKKNNPAFRNKPFIDIYFRALNRKNMVMGSGFLTYLLAYFESQNWDYEFEDLREYETEQFDENKIKSIDWDNTLLVKPRQYQIDATKIALMERQGLVKAPTGAGKSYMMALLIKILNSPTLILFDKVSLVHQTRNEFIRFGFDAKECGVIQGNNNLPKKYTFATIQSKDKLLDFLELFKVIVIDEAHGIRAISYQEILTQFKYANRYGFSATPLSMENSADKAKIIYHMGRIIYDEKTTNELINSGVLAKAHIYFIKCDRGDEQTIVWENSGRDYHNLYKQEIVENEYRNALIAKICSKKKTKKIVVLYEIIEHGDELMKMLKKLLPDREIFLLSGKDDVKTRMKAIDNFEKGENSIIVASRIFDQGVDIKSVDVVINTGAGKGFIKAVQRLGRGLRKSGNKESVEYFDILDENSRVLERQSKRRIAIYKKEGHVVETIEPNNIK